MDTSAKKNRSTSSGSPVEQSVSRRGFLKGMAAGGAVLASAPFGALWEPGVDRSVLADRRGAERDARQPGDGL